MSEWIKCSEQLPSAQNGFVDELVLVCVKNKNKTDGIYLRDVCAFDGESWCERFHTWEDITHWMPLPAAPEAE